MQEEVENRTVNLAISTSKLTARTIIGAVRIYLNHRRNVSAKKEWKKEKSPTGRQTVKELIGQGEGVTNLDIAKTDLHGFERVARKYGIDYALRKDASVDPPKYLVFFKAKDTDGMMAAVKEYSQRFKKKDEKERPSVLNELQRLRELVARIPRKVIRREKQREQVR